MYFFDLVNNVDHFCIIVTLFPWVVYHVSEEYERRIDWKIKFQIEPVSLTLAVILWLCVSAGIGTAPAALKKGYKQIAQWQNTLVQDLRALEN